MKYKYFYILSLDIVHNTKASYSMRNAIQTKYKKDSHKGILKRQASLKNAITTSGGAFLLSKLVNRKSRVQFPVALVDLAV